jgi:hypothetical protein
MNNKLKKHVVLNRSTPTDTLESVHISVACVEWDSFDEARWKNTKPIAIILPTNISLSLTAIS